MPPKTKIFTNLEDLFEYIAGQSAFDAQKKQPTSETCEEGANCATCPAADDCMPFAEDEVDGDIVIDVEIDDDGEEESSPVQCTSSDEYHTVKSNLDLDDDEHPCEDCWGYGIPCVDRVIFSGPATVVIFADGTKSMVKCMEGEKFERYAGFCAAIMKRLFGSTTAAKNLMEEHDVARIAEAREAERREKEAEKKRREEREFADQQSAFAEAVADMIYAKLVESEANRMLSNKDIRAFYNQLTGGNLEKEEKKDETPAE